MTLDLAPVNSSVKLSVVLACSALLSACAAGPTRNEPEKFNTLYEGKISPSNATVFAECLLDGFDKSHFMLTNATSRQQRRTDSFRVETLAGGRLILVSADVFDDGRVQLLEAKAASLVNTSGERDAFLGCLDRFKVEAR
jgi:hypothetical protein